MTPEEIKNLFKQFYDQTINLDGLVLFLDDVEQNNSLYYDFYFKMSNPNDVSYYKGIVTEELKTFVDDFCGYLNIEAISTILGTEETLYFNKELYNRIENVFKKVKYIDFDHSYYQPATNQQVELNYRIYFDHIKIKKYWEYDSIVIYDVVRPTKALLNGKDCSIRSAINAYDEFLTHKETYYETEKYFLEIDTILSDYPLVSVDYVAQYYHIKFI